MKYILLLAVITVGILRIISHVELTNGERDLKNATQYFNQAQSAGKMAEQCALYGDSLGMVKYIDSFKYYKNQLDSISDKN